MDSEQNKNDFYIYPNIEASYAVVNSIVVAYAAGIKGDIYQNTYFDFAQSKPLCVANPRDTSKFNALQSSLLGPKENSLKPLDMI